MISKKTLESIVTDKLKKYSDIEIILLKGHLVIEQALNHLISTHQLDMIKIEKKQLGFYKTLELAKEFGVVPYAEINSRLVDLNRIRNKLAHNLFFDEYHDDLKKWASDVLGYEPKTINTKRTYKNHVIKAFAFLTGILLGMSDGIKAVKALRKEA